MKLAIFNKKITMCLAATAAFFLTAACRSTPVIIDSSMTSQELIQKGQDSYQNGKYKAAFKYYQAVIDMYGSDNASYVEARYEIGHLYMKKKDYKSAKPIFEEIVEIFKNSIPGTLPAAYNKLAEIELAKIPIKAALSEKTQ